MELVLIQWYTKHVKTVENRNGFLIWKSHFYKDDIQDESEDSNLVGY